MSEYCEIVMNDCNEATDLAAAGNSGNRLASVGGSAMQVDDAFLCRVSSKYVAERDSPLARWHLGRKFETMAQVFRRYLQPGCRFLDIGCGEGDCMAVARAIEPSCQLWGVDIDEPALAVARQRLPGATISRHDMAKLGSLPQASFDVVHEFGAAFLVEDWGRLARSYLSLARKGGLVLWELPDAMSMAHWSYLLSPAPRNTDRDTLPRRIWRSFSPGKVHFESWAKVRRHLDSSGYSYRILSRDPFIYFHVRGRSSRLLNLLLRRTGIRVVDRMDGMAKAIFRRSSAYYLVIENLGPKA
jgi:SAM-dependent methyltransferase